MVADVMIVAFKLICVVEKYSAQSSTFRRTGPVRQILDGPDDRNALRVIGVPRAPNRPGRRLIGVQRSGPTRVRTIIRFDVLDNSKHIRPIDLLLRATAV